MVRSFNVQPNQSLLDSSDPTESHFANTHTRSEDGVYIVEYPFKDGAPPIDSTLPQAANRLVSLERRFRRHPELKKQYEEFLDDYLQRGHMKKLTSDQVMEEALNARWRALVEDLSSVTQCKVPPYIAAPYQHIQLHGIADASMHAYGAVVYSRVALDGKFHINLVAAKTRVAPIKSVSIPRLELNAALLLTRLLTIVKASLTIPVNRRGARISERYSRD